MDQPSSLVDCGGARRSCCGARRPLPGRRRQSEPSFDPKGPIYDTHDHVTEVFASSSSIREVLFIVESPTNGDTLSRDALLELKQNQDALLADSESKSHLATVFARHLGVTIEGVYSIANAVDDALPGGLDSASTPT